MTDDTTVDATAPSPVTDDHLKLLLNAYWEWNDCDHGAPGIHPKRPFGNSNVRADLAELLPELSEDAREEVFRDLPTVIVYMARNWPAATPAAQSAAEPAYRCGQCGASGCRLFRPYQTFIDPGSLRCAACAAASEGIDDADLSAGQIGWHVLAVPTTPGYDSFWGYTSVPDEPLAWWLSLPVKPTAAGGAS